MAELDTYISTLAAPEPARQRHLTPEAVRGLAQKYGQQHGVDPKVLYAMARTETGRSGTSFDAQAVSKAGAKGLMQFMDGTAQMYGIDPLDPEQAMDGAARYMKDALGIFRGDYTKAIASYNAGPAAVRSYGGVPPFKETQDYVRLTSQFMAEPEQAPSAASTTQNINDVRPAAPTAAQRYVFPVQGYKGKVDLHHGKSSGGSDIFAPEGTPVASMGSGVVTSVGTGGLGGNAVTILGDDGRSYYYAHMRDAPSVREGQRLNPGAPLGVVGTTGNAAGTPPHLHIGIGKSIINGAGSEGGTGSDFDAVSFLGTLLKEPAQQSSTPDPTGSSVRDPSDVSPATLASNGFSTPPTQRQSTGPTGPSVRDSGSRDDWRLEPHPHPDTDLIGPDKTPKVTPLGAMDLEKALSGYAPGDTPKLQSLLDQPDDYFARLLDPMSSPLPRSGASARRTSSFPFTLGGF